MTPAELFEKNFARRSPSSVGLYLVACAESDFEPWHVAVTGVFGAFKVHDAENAAGCIFRLADYCGGLTELHWKRIA